ncbi:MAG: FmdB family zinc ribbon protein [Actinomycetota bacterium]|jgi:putative FmdB family regulatory protein
MPVYEYACKACGHHLEVSQSFKDAPLTECPVCGGPLRKVFHSIGVVLKGSGFYRTDSRLPAKKSEGGDKPAGAGKDGGGGDSSAPAKAGTDGGSDSGTVKADPKPSGPPASKSA